MSVTMKNTKANGRRMAAEMISDGATVAHMRSVTDAIKSPEFRNRHVVAGFVEVVRRRACWHDQCDRYRHADDMHTDSTGFTWIQTRG